MATTLPACFDDPGDRRPGPGPDSPGWSGSDSSAYRAGHSDGSKDKRQGRRDDPHPRRDQFPPAARDHYLRGYRDGYRHANDNPWSKPRAEELGHRHGRQDRHAGRTMDPNRHSGEVPGAVRSDFNRGYREGWNTAGVTPPVRPPGPTPEPRPIPH